MKRHKIKEIGKYYVYRFGRWYTVFTPKRCRHMVTAKVPCVGVEGHTHDHFYYLPEGILVSSPVDPNSGWGRSWIPPKSKYYVPPGTENTYLSFRPLYKLVRDKNTIRRLDRGL